MVSQYELDRQANIARNRALLEDLELKEAVGNLALPSSSKTSAKPKPVQSAKKSTKKVEPALPTRRSTRFKNIIDPNESPSKKRKREAELEEQREKEREEKERLAEQERLAKRPRKENLNLDILGENEEDISSLAPYLRALPKQPLRKTWDPESSTDRLYLEELHELKSKLQNLRVVSRAKVTSNRVYSAAYHPDVSKDLIFFGDKHGELGIWDAQAPVEEAEDEDGDISSTGEGGRYWRLQVHWPASSTSSISSVKICPTTSHSVYTTSYDCTIRHLSFETGISTQIYSTDDKVLISNIDLLPSGQEMWMADALGGITHIDLREPKMHAMRFEVSDKKVGSVSVNPVYTNFLVTASNNQSLKIWDSRMLYTLAEKSSDSKSPSFVEFEHDIVTTYLKSDESAGCLRGEWKHGKSVTSAYWDPQGRRMVSTCYDDTLRVWDFPTSWFGGKEPFKSLRPLSQIKHNCQTGKWLTMLRAQWSPNPRAPPHFTVGNMNHSLDIFSGKGDLVARLSDQNKISAVQAVTCSHPTILERAVSGNASGRCVLWAPST